MARPRTATYHLSGCWCTSCTTEPAGPMVEAPRARGTVVGEGAAARVARAEEHSAGAVTAVVAPTVAVETEAGKEGGAV